MDTPLVPSVRLPYKSAAAALMFSIFLGPVGLLYATFWGGLCMIAVGIVVISSKLFFSTFLFWIFCCIWAVGAVEHYNKKIYQGLVQRIYAKTNYQA